MTKIRLLWQLYPSYLLITLLALLAVSWYSSRSLKTFFLEHLNQDLEARAWMAESQLKTVWDPADFQKINTLCVELGKRTQTRYTVILPSGEVVGESDEYPNRMENHLNRPEIQQALQGEVGSSSRYSPTLESEMKYIAVPLRAGGQLVGVVRTSLSSDFINHALWRVYRQIAVGGLIVAAAAAGISLFVSNRIGRPLLEMKRLSQAIARGEMGLRLPVMPNRELGTLAESMNQMAVQLDSRIRTIMQQRNEQEAILSSMVEGVLAVDNNERIISLNQACARQFFIENEKVIGKSIQEAVRNTDLHKFVARVLSNRSPLEGDIYIREGEGRFLQAHGASLLGADGERIGAVVVLNDLTRLRKLENLRREFVANVSHELKTPITSIKGFVETLLEGAMNSPEDAERFLRIIAKHTDRLGSIIEDLLSLSRIEQETEKSKIDLKEGLLNKVVENAIECCEARANEKNIQLESECPESLTARINPPLLEQALVNLVDNAIKYSDSNSKIGIHAFDRNGSTIIEVVDQGCGIEKEHLPRVFERFYRVDKARSRKLGGTGLGLAIVKHIAQTHGGQVTVQSTPGLGSTFAIHLPKI